MMMFDFDCLNRNRVDLSLAENLVGKGHALNVVDDWFKVPHILHERNPDVSTIVSKASDVSNHSKKVELERKPAVPKQSGVKRDRSAMNTEKAQEIEEGGDENSAGNQSNAFRRTASVKARKQESVREGSVLMNKVRIAEKFHKQIVKNNLLAMNNDNTQILPATKKVKAQATLPSQAELAREAAQQRRRIAEEKARKMAEEKEVAAKRAEVKQIERSKARKSNKTHSVMAVRKWEMKTGKQYALLSSAEREAANAEISKAT